MTAPVAPLPKRKTRPKTDPATHKTDWRLKAKIKAEKGEAASAAVRRTEALSAPADPMPSGEAEWRALICSLPGFDPFALAGDCTFDATSAAHAIDFIENHVRHRKGPLGGQFFRMRPWQRAFVANLFGWYRADGVTYRFTEAMLYVAKKNSKSLACEGIALYKFIEDGEIGAEVYCAAAKRDQARIVWDGCRWQITHDEYLKSKCDVYQYTITKEDSGFLKPISSDADTEDGMNPSCLIFDELHRQQNANLVNMGRLSAVRPNALILHATTSDEERESVCNDTLKRAKEVRDNPGDPSRPGFDASFLPAIYEADEADDWTIESTWRKANPNLGYGITLDQVAKECREAKENPALQADFRRYRLNQRVKTTNRMFDMVAWDLGGAKIDAASLTGRPCVVGIDIASTDDLVAQVAYFPSVKAAPGASPFLPSVAIAWFWVPEAQASEESARTNRNVGLYRSWSATGHLTLTPGNQIDDDRVLSSMIENVKGFKVREWAFDPAGATRYTQRLMDLGVAVTAVRQGWFTMSEPLKTLVVEVGRGELVHGGNPVLRWCANNATRTVDDKDTWSLVKPKDHLKIDGIAALATAKARAMVIPTDRPRADPSTMATFVPFRFGR